ncbi:MAG TPA: helix-hairpin-helix domain-containing protein [Nitrospirales bacterium]|nr:helix-hairpin-helix domain-containing protein [Nitrospirales bacterium]
MTVLKALAINVLMLAVTVGVLYWAAERGNDTESAQAIALLSQAGSTIPVSVKPVPSKTGSVPRHPVSFPLDLNSALMEDFLELPGIGEELAQRLVEYRKSHGGFRSVEDLRKVRGIGEKRMERLRTLVRTAEAP